MTPDQGHVRVRLVGRDHRLVGVAQVPAWGPYILKIGHRLFCPYARGVYREATIHTDFTALPYEAKGPRKRKLTPGSD